MWRKPIALERVVAAVANRNSKRVNSETRTSDQMFDSVVANAIDFLTHSVDELETKPKYSVINFCAAIELFLKAKLMLEHWSLVTEEPNKANTSQFQAGDFKSVGIDETLRRLQNISNVRIPREAHRIFSQLREHRSKMVHFFHPDYVSDPKEETIKSIVSEQSKAWFYLHHLLARDWKTEFQDYQEEIEELHALVKEQRAYLKEKFENLLPDIEKGRNRGSRILGV